MKRSPAGSLFHITFAAIAIAAAGCGGNTTTPAPIPQQTSTPTPSPPLTQSQPVTTTLIANSPLQLPPIPTVSGTITYSASSVPSGTSVTFQTFLGVPTNAPVPQTTRHGASTAGYRRFTTSPTAVVSFMETFSNTVTFAAFPIISIQIPTSVTGEYTAEIFDLTNPLPAPYYENGTGVANGAFGVKVTFSGGGSAFTVNAGDKYLVEVVSGSALGLPPPTPSMESSTTIITGNAQLIQFPAVGGFSGNIQIPANTPSGEQAILLDSWNGTPTSQVPLDSTGMAGSNDFSIEATLSETESFAPGLFAFSLTFPSSIQLSSSSVVTIFLCTESVDCSSGSATPISSSLDPSLFAISGETVTFSGIPSSFTLTAGQTILAEVYIR